MTNEKKQIEEMAKDLCPLFKEYGECSTCDAVIDIGDEPCVYRCMAEMILDKGYRKASDVAREIIAEIEENMTDIRMEFATLRAIGKRQLAKIKKKYESEENKNDH